MIHRALPFAVLALTASAVAAGPLAVTTRMLVESRAAAADGTMRTTLIVPATVVPGDRVTVVLAYRNTGAQPIANLTLANPVPQGMAFRGASQGTRAPEVSVDGVHFGSLPSLRVGAPGGTPRAAVAGDVTHVRWRLAAAVAPGTGGELAFQAVVK